MPCRGISSILLHSKNDSPAVRPNTADYKSGGSISWLSGRACIALCVALSLLGTIAAFRRPPLADTSWYLYLAAQGLDGARLDLDYLETNPPLITWLTMIPVAAARKTGISAYHSLLIFLLALSVGSLVVAERLLAKVPKLPDAIRHALVVAASFAMFVLPRLDFSQREHIVVILTLPWMCLAMVRACRGSVPQGAAFVIGFAGAIGFALKPFFLCAWLMVEAYVICRTGMRAFRRTELITLVATGAAYVAAVLVFTPDYVPRAYSTMSLYGTYLNNGVNGAIVLGLATPLFLFMLGGLAHLNADRRLDAVRDVLIAATFGFFFAAVVQRKGWHYHYIAALGYGFVLLAAVVLRTDERRSKHVSVLISAMIVRLSWPVVLAVSISASAATSIELLSPDKTRYRQEPSLDLLVPVVRREAAGQHIMVFSSNPASAWPLTTQAGALWSSRYMSYWELAALYHQELWNRDGPVVFRPLAERSGLEREFHETAIEDLNRFAPKLLVVLERDDTTRAGGGAARLDYLRYFGEDPRFTAFFRHYEDIGRVGAYRLYRRRFS
jgi:hypothetical protein